MGRRGRLDLAAPHNRETMTEPPNTPPTRLKSWVLPLAIASVAVIVLGVIATYANTTFGAAIVLVGLCGVVVVAREASRSVDDDADAT
jgi:hypothetical protein